MPEQRREIPEYRELVFALQRHLQYEAPADTPSMSVVAGRLDVQVSTVSRWVRGDNRLGLNEFIELFHAYDRPRAVLAVLVRLLDPTAVVGHTGEDGIADGSVDDEFQELAIKVGRLFEEHREDLADGRLDDRELARLRGRGVEIMKLGERIIRESEAMTLKAKGE